MLSPGLEAQRFTFTIVISLSRVKEKEFRPYTGGMIFVNSWAYHLIVIVV